MADPEQAAAYARADFATVNQGFVDRFRQEFPDFTQGRILDLGCGPADIPVRLARALPGVEITAVDASGPMLDLARREVDRLGLGRRVALLRARLPGLPLRAGRFQGIVSNSLLHHLAEADLFWAEVRHLGQTQARLLVMDLCRPESEARARALVDAAAAGEAEILRRDFFNSLLAAFAVAEVDEQLRRAHLGHLHARQVSDRHWVVAGTV